MDNIDRTTENLNGHWSDRFTKAELIARLKEIGSRRNPTLMKDAAYVLEGGSVAIDIGTLSDEVGGYAIAIAKRFGAYDDASFLGDVSDALQEIEEMYATHMNLPLHVTYTGPLCGTCAHPAICREKGPCANVPAQGTCEHGHQNCNPIGTKCGDECD